MNDQLDRIERKLDQIILLLTGGPQLATREKIARIRANGGSVAEHLRQNKHRRSK